MLIDIIIDYNWTIKLGIKITQQSTLLCRNISCLHLNGGNYKKLSLDSFFRSLILSCMIMWIIEKLSFYENCMGNVAEVSYDLILDRISP